MNCIPLDWRSSPCRNALAQSPFITGLCLVEKVVMISISVEKHASKSKAFANCLFTGSDGPHSRQWTFGAEVLICSCSLQPDLQKLRARSILRNVIQLLVFVAELFLLCNYTFSTVPVTHTTASSVTSFSNMSVVLNVARLGA